MKIGVVSDSHGMVDRLLQAVDEMGSVDVIIHLGDHADDAEAIRSHTSVPVMVVEGNCDLYSAGDYPENLITTLGGKKIFASHGHRQHVKMELDRFIIEARAYDADIALFGHTHTPFRKEEEGMLVLNPGSCALPNGGNKPSYAVITIEEDQVKAEIHEFEPKRNKKRRKGFFSI